MNQANKSILIVDDDADIRSNFYDILTAMGYAAETAADAESALEMVTHKRYDVALLDYKLPKMNGVDLYQAMKRVRPEIAAIMVSAHGGQQAAEQAKQFGAWEVLRKPVDIGRLLEMVKVASEAPLVLVVDDDVDFCQSLWDVLNHRHFRVLLAHNETDGIQLGLEAGCEIIVVDLRLGNGDGCNVVRECQRANRPIRTILVTGHREADIDAQLNSVFDAVVYKPIKVDDLLATMN